MYTGNAYTQPSLLDKYMETYRTMSKVDLYFFLFIQLVWLILLITHVWRYIQIQKGNHERINIDIENLYGGSGKYENMLEGVKKYTLLNMVISVVLFTAGLLFPSYIIQLINVSIYTSNRRYWKGKYQDNPNPTFIHRDGL